MLRQSLAKVKGNGKTELQGRTQEFQMRQGVWGFASHNFRWRRNSAEDKLGRKLDIFYQSVLSFY